MISRQIRAAPDTRDCLPSRFASREEHRRQLAPPGEGRLVGRAPGLEELEQLLACRLLVPITVLAEDFKEPVGCRLAVAARIEGEGEVEAGLVVGRVCRRPWPRARRYRRVGGLGGEIDAERARRRSADRSARPPAPRRASGAPVELAGGEEAAGETGERGDQLGIALERGAEALGGGGDIAGVESGFALGDQLLGLGRARPAPATRSMKAFTWLSGRAPTKPSTGCPLTKAMTAGIDWMPSCPAIAGWSSMFILTSRTAPLAARTAFSMIGPSVLHGPHHGAQKSTRTGWRRDSSITSLAKAWVVVSRTRSSPGPALSARPVNPALMSSFLILRWRRPRFGDFKPKMALGGDFTMSRRRFAGSSSMICGSWPVARRTQQVGRGDGGRGGVDERMAIDRSLAISASSSTTLTRPAGR